MLYIIYVMYNKKSSIVCMSYILFCMIRCMDICCMFDLIYWMLRVFVHYILYRSVCISYIFVSIIYLICRIFHFCIICFIFYSCFFQIFDCISFIISLMLCILYISVSHVISMIV